MTDRLELDDGTILCERVSDMPQPGVSSAQRTCDYCGESVWVDLVGLPIADAPNIIVACTRCLVIRPAGEVL